MHVPQSTVRPQPSEIDPQLKPWPAHVVGTQFWGTTVSVSLYDREPSVAVRVTVVVVATGAVVMVTVSTLLPAEMVTLDGTLATWGLSLESAIVGPPDGETALSQTDAIELLPPVTGSLSTESWPSVCTGWAGGGSGGVIASQASPSRWLRKIPPFLMGTGISMLVPTEENSTEGRIEVATWNKAAVAPGGIGKKPVGKAVVWELLELTNASDPDGAAESSESVPWEALPLSRRSGLSAIGYGPLRAHASVKEKFLDISVWQPAARHPALKVNVPTVPGLGPSKQV